METPDDELTRRKHARLDMLVNPPKVGSAAQERAIQEALRVPSYMLGRKR